MNEDDLRDVAERLEALASLAKLFGNSWLEDVKNQISDEKVRAYLTVFDDAFPGMDHVVEFVCQNAHALATGEDVQENFAGLAQALLQRESADSDSPSVENDMEVMEEPLAPEEQDDTRVAEENVEIVPDAEQEDKTKPTSDKEQSKNEDQIDALFG